MNTKELRLPVGVSDFKEIVEDDLYFVDKSLWIKEVVESSEKVLLFTRPRRFGKTLNMSMIKYFLSSSHAGSELFKGKNIAKYKSFCSEFQNKHPVIFISFKDIKQSSFKELFATLKLVISSLYKKHSYLLDSDKLLPIEKENIQHLMSKNADRASIIESLKSLSEYLAKISEKKVYILIDEYDTPITAGYLNDFYKDVIELMRDMLGFALKDNEFLKKGVITGITKVSKERLFSGVNNLEVYSMLDSEYGQFFGFTEVETKSLLKEDNNIQHLGKVKEWYNGYQIGEYTIYNPWSIIKCVKKNYRYLPYWVNTADNSLINELISEGKHDIKEKFIDLLQNKPIKAPLIENLTFLDLKTDEEALWSLLHATGYIKSVNEVYDYDESVDLAIPNKEVSYVYKDMIKRWFTKAVSLKSYERFITSLANSQIDIFHIELSSFLQESGSYFDFNENSPEQVFHTFMLGIVIGLRDSYIILSNRESGYGRYDLSLIPKSQNTHGIILEFKTVSKGKDLKTKAREGIDQIKDKKYYTVFKQYKIKSLLILGLAFYKKKVEIVSELHDVDSL